MENTRNNLMDMVESNKFTTEQRVFALDELANQVYYDFCHNNEITETKKHYAGAIMCIAKSLRNLIIEENNDNE